jgi:UDP-N-acetylmuramyl tripeptide synthase
LGSIRFFIALWGAKLIKLLLKLLGRKGTYFSGKAAIKICPEFLGRIGKPSTIIGVTGTNGKTTVCNMITDLLEAGGEDVLSNRLGSNINAGIATALIDGASIFGKSRKSIAVLEIDERSARLIYPYVKPDYIVCTNLFRDSMRRNAHPEYIADILTEYIPRSSKLILNADDLVSSAIAPENERIYFGMERLESEQAARENIVMDILVCPKCGKTMKFDFRRYHHIGRLHCECGFASPKPDYTALSADFETMRFRVSERGTEREYPLITDTVFNIYNELAAITVLRELGKSSEDIEKALKNTEIVQSRFWEESVDGKTVTMLMAKGLNAVACSRGFDYVSREQGEKVVALLYDDIFDEKETSENIAWIYDVDYEFLKSDDIVQILPCGVRAEDGKMRLLIAGVPESKIMTLRREEELAGAIKYLDADRIFLLYDVYRHDIAVKVRAEVVKRIRGLAL